MPLAVTDYPAGVQVDVVSDMKSFLMRALGRGLYELFMESVCMGMFVCLHKSSMDII